MIKVNLLKNRGSGGRGATTDAAETNFDENFEDAFGSDESGSGGAGKKAFFILVSCLILYGYEWYNISHLQAENARAQSSVTQLDKEISTLRPKIEVAKKLQNENEELNKKLNLVKQLGRLRLREIRAIDHLQNIIPEKVWFQTIRFTETSFEVIGQSANDQELDKLLEGIRENPTFVDVLLARSIEQKSPQGNIKLFTITSGLNKEI